MNIAKNNKGLKGKLLIAIVLPLLTSCSTYSSGFACGDAKGVACTPMERIDQLISSGEIEAYVDKKKKCRGKTCRNIEKSDDLQRVLSSNKKI